MTRVSESSSIHAIQHAVNKTKSRLEDLQIKGSNLKRVQKPSDDPIGNTEILSIRSKKIDNNQYQRNASVAKAQLTFSENAIEELADIMVKAKEIAISQASNIFDVNVRKGVAKEIEQLRNQSISIANRRLGNKYIFAGHKSLTKPFDTDGKYLGDKNQTKVEVAKDYFVPISFNGQDIFFEKDFNSLDQNDPLANTSLNNLKEKIKIEDGNIEDTLDNADQSEFELNRTPASEGKEQEKLKAAKTSVFDDLQRLHNALVTDNHEIIQDLLPKMDKSIDRLIEHRTKIGSIINSIDTSTDTIEKQNLINEEYKSKVEDADIGELFTDLTRQKNVLNATYKASAQLMNKNLMDYIN